MAVYRFKVIFEDYEEVSREIEIKSVQTFEDLNNCILNAIDFEPNNNVSFYISDDYWRKGEEIKLISDDKAKRKMGKTKIAALIDDPHQKFLFTYDSKQTHWTLLVELLKIVPDNPSVSYPTCIKKEGVAPKAINTTIIDPNLLEDDEDFEDELEGDSAAYANAHLDESIADLEEEEIDEEEEDELDQMEDDMGEMDNDMDDDL